MYKVLCILTALVSIIAKGQSDRHSLGITAAFPNFIQFNYHFNLSEKWSLAAGYSPCAIVFNNSGYLRFPDTYSLIGQVCFVF
jgi:hypothetical protein